MCIVKFPAKCEIQTEYWVIPNGVNIFKSFRHRGSPNNIIFSKSYFVNFSEYIWIFCVLQNCWVWKHVLRHMQRRLINYPEIDWVFFREIDIKIVFWKMYNMQVSKIREKKLISFHLFTNLESIDIRKNCLIDSLNDYFVFLICQLFSITIEQN